MRRLTSLFLLVLALPIASSARADEETPPPCLGPLILAQALVADESRYMPRWRETAFLRAEDGPPWAEGTFLVEGDASSDAGATHVFRPTRLSFSGVINAVYRRIGPDADPAITLLLDAAMADGAVLGPAEDVSHERAVAIVERAIEACLT